MAPQPGLRSLRDVHVLLLEDEPILLIAFEDDLLDLGCSRVSSFSSASDALIAIERSGFDVAVLDIHLGNNQTSYGVARRLTELSTPFVFASGSSGEEVPAEFRLVPLISKPFDLRKLEAALVNTLDRGRR